ncbi:serine/threonine protein kinase [Spiractinospora alimapuensis]|uniref:serine/threonine-protein kinase n=1 Tax=Spiractinospora alimapuensis TaxID=2820884 RepID=UPI0022AA0736|nr:serine/threonine-protein kinase [Spiractinospora alimapuensis]QVQ51745.1 serine/threonine protein kinase [Spiractinospora alimapuensis]
MASRRPFPATLKPVEAGDPSRVGPYRIVGRLGAGGMGAVYGAVDGDGLCLAVKLVHPEFADNDEFRARFAREVRLVERVNARCTPAFAGADPDADTPWLATEYVPGPTLREHVTTSGPMPEGMVLALAAGLAEALHAIHSAGIVHRDLKPSNVILAPDGPKVLDFGIARALDGTGITRTGGLMGSPGWIAPERYHGAEASPAADIFAWGGLVAFAATGRSPYGTGSPQVVADRTMHNSPDIQGTPEVLYPLVEGALAPDPNARPEPREPLTALKSHTGYSIPDDPPSTLVATLIETEWRNLPDTIHVPQDWKAHADSGTYSRVWVVMATAAVALVILGATTYLTLDHTSETDTAETQDPPSSALEANDSNPEQLPDNVAGEGEYIASDPGIYRQSINGEPIIEITMETADPSPTGVDFNGSVEYLAESGSLSFGSGYFYVATGDTTDPADSANWIHEPGEILGVLSPQEPKIQFTLSVSMAGNNGAGALVLKTDTPQTDPHLCYRSEPYAETGTQFLHNEGDSWRDCAADPYE